MVSILLKIEKKSDNGEVTVTLRQRCSPWDASFLKALLYAVAIHLFGFLIFSIQIFLHPKAIQLPLTIVDVFNDASAVQTGQEKQRKPYPFFLPASKPEIPSLAQFTAFPEKFYVQSSDVLLSYTPVRVHLSGNLAGREMVILKGMSPIQTSLPLHEYVMHYIVQIDNTTGKVFWHHLEKGIDDKEIENWGEKILAELQFAKQLESPITIGGIDVMITRSINQKTIYD